MCEQKSEILITFDFLRELAKEDGHGGILVEGLSREHFDPTMIWFEFVAVV